MKGKIFFNIKYMIAGLLRMRGKINFIRTLPHGAKVLDVGCGNNSPYLAKTLRPDIFYVGLDVSHYNQKFPPHAIADRYLVTVPEDFSRQIRQFSGEFDAVISSHNIEHCLDPEEVLRAMLQALKAGGRIFLAFPCEASVNFPRRAGTLNFYDNTTHLSVPRYQAILESIRHEGFRLEFSTPRYRPFILFLIGMVLEPISAARKKIFRLLNPTWAFYGYESVIWAIKEGAVNLGR